MSKLYRNWFEECAENIAACDWPGDTSFYVTNDPDPHKPCWLVMPGGAMLEFNHHAGEGVDLARANWIAEACNQRLKREGGLGE